ncbi:unnamed protein product [Arabidopsis lyrata]|nr:uncharacterized protein LOC9321632 [Arabidopsis lyrata subsp. lyrata]CAH8261549.1 unnamed protein product [Arabidopsis lyrata]|eukprot:XP_020887667.1 uncharacterized protein LOC9321632 [Arabidopsis lyrata subsp. lyrata]
MNQNHHAREVQSHGASRKRKETESDPRATAPNWLLAGYMAHEYLTCGTMLGRKLYPGWAEVGPHIEAKKAHQSYSEVATVFKTDGNHVPGVVNPTQLAKWIQM